MRPPIVPSPMNPIFMLRILVETFGSTLDYAPLISQPVKGPMESFFEWLQGLSISNWIATDEVDLEFSDHSLLSQRRHGVDRRA